MTAPRYSEPAATTGPATRRRAAPDPASRAAATPIATAAVAAERRNPALAKASAVVARPVIKARFSGHCEQNSSAGSKNRAGATPSTATKATKAAPTMTRSIADQAPGWIGEHHPDNEWRGEREQRSADGEGDVRARSGIAPLDDQPRRSGDDEQSSDPVAGAARREDDSGGGQRPSGDQQSNRAGCIRGKRERPFIAGDRQRDQPDRDNRRTGDAESEPHRSIVARSRALSSGRPLVTIAG